MKLKMPSGISFVNKIKRNDTTVSALRTLWSAPRMIRCGIARIQLPITRQRSTSFPRWKSTRTVSTVPPRALRLVDAPTAVDHDHTVLVDGLEQRLAGFGDPHAHCECVTWSDRLAEPHVHALEPADV